MNIITNLIRDFENILTRIGLSEGLTIFLRTVVVLLFIAVLALLADFTTRSVVLVCFIN